MGVERILVVDGESVWRDVLAQRLERKGFDLSLVSDSEAGTAALQKSRFDALVVAAHHVPDLATAGIPLIAAGTLEEAISAMQAGAVDFLVRPLTSDAVGAALSRLSPISPLVAESPAMKKIMAELPRIAQSDASVLISGESGTGKELIAAEIHRLSRRAAKPYIRVNCAAIPDALVESEFFGHEKGAFTGASAQRQGRFERAHRGTLLLDEITEFPLHLQAKLLRALQEGEFERVGGSRPLCANVRIIATSNRDLRSCLDEGSFRQDLYYRLNVLPIHLPPLRERPEDLLAFLPKDKHFTEKDIEKLLKHNWPGNIRELSNLLERASILDSDGIYLA